jgi:hypothetical protein
VAEVDAVVHEERGVHNPRVVDLVRLDAAADAVELLMLETRPWGSDPRQLEQLEAKFNSYLGYVQTGPLTKKKTAKNGSAITNITNVPMTASRLWLASKTTIPIPAITKPGIKAHQ